MQAICKLFVVAAFASAVASLSGCAIAVVAEPLLGEKPVVHKHTCSDDVAPEKSTCIR